MLTVRDLVDELGLELLSGEDAAEAPLALEGPEGA